MPWSKSKKRENCVKSGKFNSNLLNIQFCERKFVKSSEVVNKSHNHSNEKLNRKMSRLFQQCMYL